MGIKQKLKILGVDLAMIKNSFKGIKDYLSDYNELIRQRNNDDTFFLGPKFPVFVDRFLNSGTMSGHYFHQDILVAQKIFRNNPVRHIDIGSRTDGFVAHVAVFREIEILDIRPQESKTPNVIFKQADLMKLPEDMIECCDSLSSLHAIEHFGLGRYGDPVDYYGYLKAIENLYSILKLGGRLYFSVPIGTQRIEFNAHRVFDIKYLLGLFDGKYTIQSFSYVDDLGDLHANVEMQNDDIESNFQCHFGCGIFELIKI
ncbi:MAG: hypothetical protein RIS29_2252 [Bacteroidota bacterium]|jgi:SAM-dependent methyltransferase